MGGFSRNKQGSFYLPGCFLSSAGQRQLEHMIEVWKCATQRANRCTAHADVSFLFRRATARPHPSLHHPTWLSPFRLEEENSSAFAAIQDGLNGQRLRSASKRLSLCWSLQQSHEKESQLYKGEKSPWPAYALGRLHKIALADEPGFECLQTNCVKFYIKQSTLNAKEEHSLSFPRGLLSLPSEMFFTLADLCSLGGHKCGQSTNCLVLASVPVNT